MNLKNSDVLLLIIKINPNTEIAQTKTKTTESVDLKSIETIGTLYSSPKLLLQEEIYLIVVTEKEVSISIFIITDQKKTFAIYPPSFWRTSDTKKTVRVRRKNKFKSN